MRIAVVTSDVPFVEGGHRVIARALVAALEEAGHSAELLTTPQNRFGRQVSAYVATWLTDVQLTGDGATVDRVISLRFPSYAVRHPHHVVWLNHRMREYYDLWEQFRSQLGTRGRVVESVRRFLLHRMDRALLSRRIVFAQSETIRQRLQRWGGIEATVLYPPPPQRPYRCDDYDGSVLAVGRLQPLKRVDLLLRAAALGGDWKVRVAGVGPQEAELRGLADELGINERVAFLGELRTDELVAEYARCSVVYFGAKAEDYGMVTLEAFTSAKPVVTCLDSGGPAEQVEDGITGFVVDPDSAPVAKALTRLVEDRAVAEKMGTAATAYAARHTWPLTVDRLLSA
jgi:glycosyltransferase involved in cell wall biosynthesis